MNKRLLFAVAHYKPVTSLRASSRHPNGDRYFGMNGRGRAYRRAWKAHYAPDLIATSAVSMLALRGDNAPASLIVADTPAIIIDALQSLHGVAHTSGPSRVLPFLLEAKTQAWIRPSAAI